MCKVRQSCKAGLNNWLQEERRQFKTKSRFPKKKVFALQKATILADSRPMYLKGMHILYSERTRYLSKENENHLKC